MPIDGEGDDSIVEGAADEVPAVTGKLRQPQTQKGQVPQKAGHNHGWGL
jgi:hypothetical protein